MAIGRLGARGGLGGLGLVLGKPWELPGAAVDLNFASGEYFPGGGLTSLVSCSRASSKTDLLPVSASGFAYDTFSNNVLAVTSGLGALIEEARTNLFLNSTIPVTQTITLPTTGDYTLWVNGAGSAAIVAGTATITGAGTATNGTPVVINCTVTGTVLITIVGLLNAAQLEAGAFGTSLIVTTGVTATRAADVVTGLFTVGASAGSFFAQQVIYGTNNANTGILGVVATVARPLHIAGASSPFFVNYTDTVSNAGQSGNTAVFGSVFKAASSFDGTGASIVLNGGAVTTNAFVATLAGNGGLFFGNSLGNGIVGSSYMRRVTYWTTRLTDARLKAFTV